MQHFRPLHDPPQDDLQLLLAALGPTGSPALAVRLLSTFGGLEPLGRASPGALMQVAGLTPAAATQLSASMALGRRAMGPPLVLPTKPVRSASEAVDLLSPGLRLLLEEELHVLYLDSAERPLALLSLTHGSTGNTVINAKQILRHAVQCGASAFVLAHNHPSGNPEPSLDDARATLMVMDSASLLGLRLLDHLIITQTEWTSMDELGLLGHRASGLG